MENKSKSKKTLKSKLLNSGNTLRESLKGLTSFNNSPNEQNNEISMDNNENQSPINSIIKTPPFKTIAQSSIDNVKQVSEKINKTTSSFFNITTLALILLGLIVLGIFGYIIYDYLEEENEKKDNNIFNKISNFFTKDAKDAKDAKETKDTKETKETKETKDIKKTKDTKNNNPVSLESSVKNIKPRKNIETRKSKKMIDDESTNENNLPQPIRTESLTSGFCYIGKVNDTRYCTKVDAPSKCMSGDIYPSMDVCVNPNLRA